MPRIPPPHERAWRHPSELTPPPTEPASRRHKLVILVGGVCALASVTASAMILTPRADGPVSSPSTPLVTPAGIGTGPQVRTRTVTVSVAPSELSSLDTGPIAGAELEVVAGGTRIVAAGDDGRYQYVLARDAPDDDQRVVIAGSRQRVRFGDIDALRPEPGALVLDRSGALVAVVDSDRTVRIVTIDRVLVSDAGATVATG